MSLYTLTAAGPQGLLVTGRGQSLQLTCSDLPCQSRWAADPVLDMPLPVTVMVEAASAEYFAVTVQVCCWYPLSRQRLILAAAASLAGCFQDDSHKCLCTQS